MNKSPRAAAWRAGRPCRSIALAAAWCVLGVATAALAHGPAPEPAQPDWIPMFEGGYPGGPVAALAAFDRDGQGPEGESLYALAQTTRWGRFTSPLRRWNGRVWEQAAAFPQSSAFDVGGRGSMVVHDEDGPGPREPALFVGGAGLAWMQQGIALMRLSGGVWTNILSPQFGPSQVQSVRDLAVVDGLLWAAIIGNHPATIFSWDGEVWTPATGGLNVGSVMDLQRWDPDDQGPLPETTLAAADTYPPAGIAMWTGTEWQAFTPDDPLAPPTVLAMGIYDTDGEGPNAAELYALAAYCEPQRVALVAWDRQSWREIGVLDVEGVSCFGYSGLPQWAMHVHDDDGPGPLPEALYITARVVVSEPVKSITTKLTRWDGVTLRPLGVPDPDLGGALVGGPLPRTPWEQIARTRGGDVFALASFDFDGPGPEHPRLVTGGRFLAVGLPPTTPDADDPTYRYPTNILDGAFFASWDGQAWDAHNRGVGGFMPMDANPGAAFLMPLDTDGPGGDPGWLYLNGLFTGAGPISVPLAAQSTFFTQLFNPGTLTSGANIRWSATRGWQRAGLDPEPRTQWRTIRDTAMFDPDGPGPLHESLHVVGPNIQTIGGQPAGPISRWDPLTGSWQSIGTPIAQSFGGESVYAVVAWDPDGDGPGREELWVAGDMGGVEHNGVSAPGMLLRWDGSAWLGTGLLPATVFSRVEALQVYDPDGPGPQQELLIVAGNFEVMTPDGVARHLAAYDGATWHRLGAGTFERTSTTPNQPDRSALYGLAVFDDDADGPSPPALFLLIKDSRFRRDDGSVVEPANLLRFDGVSWSATPPPENGCNMVIGQIVPFDPDGAGPFPESLFATGLQVPGGVQRRAGGAWFTLGAGLERRDYSYLGMFVDDCFMNPHAQTLAVFDDDGGGPNPPALFFAGYFNNAGGHSSWGIAKWGLTAPPAPAGCPGDADANNLVNFLDITTVLANFGTVYETSPRTGPNPGDADDSGVVDWADITAVLSNFGAQCTPR